MTQVKEHVRSLSPLRAARRFARMVLPIRYAPAVHKRSERTWPFGPFLKWVGSGRLRANGAELRPIDETAAALQSRLRGQVRETGFRHEVRKMDAGEVFDVISSPPVARAVLYRLVAQFRPQRVFELGSAFGLATMAMALALRDGGDDSASLDGIEFEPWRAEIADGNVKSVLGDRGAVHAGRIEDVLPQLVDRRGPVRFAFVDAMHTYEATMGYHRLLSGSAADGAVVVYDDIGWSEGMARFWSDVVKEPGVTDAVSVGNRWGVVRYAGK